MKPGSVTARVDVKTGATVLEQGAALSSLTGAMEFGYNEDYDQWYATGGHQAGAPIAAATGATYARVPIYWFNHEPTEGNYVWNAYIDGPYGAILAAGMPPMLCVMAARLGRRHAAFQPPRPTPGQHRLLRGLRRRASGPVSRGADPSLERGQLLDLQRAAARADALRRDDQRGLGGDSAQLTDRPVGDPRRRAGDDQLLQHDVGRDHRGALRQGVGAPLPVGRGLADRHRQLADPAQRAHPRPGLDHRGGHPPRPSRRGDEPEQPLQDDVSDVLGRRDRGADLSPLSHLEPEHLRGPGRLRDRQPGALGI